VRKGKALVTIDPDVSYAVEISYDGSEFHVWWEGVEVLSVASAPGSSPYGSAGFRVKGTTGSFGDIAVN
jgi:hypothetical protein